MKDFLSDLFDLPAAQWASSPELFKKFYRRDAKTQRILELCKT